MKKVAEKPAAYQTAANPDSMTKEELFKVINALEKQMKQAAKDLEFEKAALLRDQLTEMRQTLALIDNTALLESVNRKPRAKAAMVVEDTGKRKVKGRSRGKL